MKKLLREIQDSGVSILNEDKENGTVNILSPFVQADKLNKNNRKYSLELLNREVNKIQGQISSGEMIGMADHPKSGQGNIETASHIIKKMWLDKSGKGYVEMKILGTEKGKNIQEIIKAGGRLGLSSRGFGTVDPLTRIVKDDYVLAGIDIVMNPSSDIAHFNKENIFESVDFSQKKEDKKMDMKSKERIMETMYRKHINSGEFRGGFDEWKLKNEQFVDIALLETEQGLSYSEAVKKVFGSEKGQKVLNDEKNIQPRVTIEDVYAEARVAGIHPAEYAKKLNKEIDSQNALISNDEEVSLILREAASAGMNTADPDVKKKIIENFEKQKNETEKVLSETQKARLKIEDENLRLSILTAEKMDAGYGKKL